MMSEPEERPKTEDEIEDGHGFRKDDLTLYIFAGVLMAAVILAIWFNW